MTWDGRRGGKVVDLGVRSAYRIAHRMLRAYWFMRRPTTHGALVAVWHDDEILLVKNSYRRQYTLPGGYIRGGESPLEAASRELGEEVGVHVPPEALRRGLTAIKQFENRFDRATICEVELAERPRIVPDNREITWADFVTRERALELPLVPHLEEYLRCR